MKTFYKFTLLYLFLLLGFASSYSQSYTFEIAWSTYFGDESFRFSDNAIDSEGNFYFVGYLDATSNFTTTSNSFQPTYGGGSHDGLMVKMNPEGQVIWATYFGGEGFDIISGITIDNNDAIYIVGNTSSSAGISTPNSYQPVIDGNSDTFVARFTSEGLLEWGTYYPDVNSDNPISIFTNGFDIVADNQGYIYFHNRTSNPNAATNGTFQTNIGQERNSIISKFTTDGERIWATYYGINTSYIHSIAIGVEGLYISGETRDCPPFGSANTYFATAGSHQIEPGNCKDNFITKFSLDGNRIWSTYYGNTYQEFSGRNALLVDGDNLYFSGISRNHINITTPGSYQEDSEPQFTSYLVSFNSLGVRQWGTYIGLNLIEVNPSGFPYAMLDKDSNGNIYMYGFTRFEDHISTSTAFQPEKNTLNDMFLAIFNPAGQLQYGTYFGGNGDEYGSKPLVDGDNVYLFGQTTSMEGITTSGSYQPNYIENPGSTLDGFANIFITKLQPVPLSVNDLKIKKVAAYPNPTNGNFTIKTNESNIQNIIISSVLGQEVQNIFPKNPTSEITIVLQETGLYFATVILENNIRETLKIVVK